jgi:YbbR domain-containing protein
LFLRRLNRNKANFRPSRAAFRAFFADNLPLKIFSLALAVLMWAFVASQKRGESSEIKFTTPLVFKNIPANLEVTSAPIQAVSVLVSARRALANAINPNQFQVGIDLSKQLPGSFEYTLTERNISYNNESPPQGMTVLQVSPAVIPITLEETIRKTVEIRPRFSGDLAQGFTLESIRVKPPEAVVQGARKNLDKLKYVFTRPLDVQDLRSNVEMLAELDLPSTVRLAPNQDNFFQAQITVSNNPTRLLLRDIPIVFENKEYVFKNSTNAINVFLEGPREVMQSLRRESVVALVDLNKYPPGDYRGLAPRVVVPDTVKVLEQWPILDLFVINRKLKKP